jgi:DNA-binding transcriptional LysR family regulator
MQACRTDPDLRKLRGFLAVAERLHFGRAAAALYITQPALSGQIRQLEEEFGVEVLERSMQVSLAAAGKRFARRTARGCSPPQPVGLPIRSVAAC